MDIQEVGVWPARLGFQYKDGHPRDFISVSINPVKFQSQCYKEVCNLSTTLYNSKALSI